MVTIIYFIDLFIVPNLDFLCDFYFQMDNCNGYIRDESRDTPKNIWIGNFENIIIVPKQAFFYPKNRKGEQFTCCILLICPLLKISFYKLKYSHVFF